MNITITKKTAAALTALTLALSLAACTQNKTDEATQSEQSTPATIQQSAVDSGNTVETASTFLTDFYTKLTTQSDMDEDALTRDIDTIIGNTIDPNTTIDDTINNATPEQITQLLAVLDKANPVIDCFDLTDLSDQDHAKLDLAMYMMNTLYASMDYTPTIDPQGITINPDSTATINDTAVTLTAPADTKTPTRPGQALKLNNVNGKWKIDATDYLAATTNR